MGDSMFTVVFSIADFLDRAKAGAGGVTDYRLAKLIGVTPATISHYRAGQRLPDAATIKRICDYSGDDAMEIAAEIQALRATDEEGAELWRQVAERLRHAVLVIVAAVIANLALSPLENAAADQVSTVYYVKWLIWAIAAGSALAQLAKVAALLRRKVHSPRTSAESRVSPK